MKYNNLSPDVSVRPITLSSIQLLNLKQTNETLKKYNRTHQLPFLCYRLLSVRNKHAKNVCF